MAIKRHKVEGKRRKRPFTFFFSPISYVYLIHFIAFAAIILLGTTATSIGYFYCTYAKIIDERLASGYLTSRAGIYAAPRVLRVGQSFSRQRLIEVLRRAGYVEAEASKVWNGGFTAQDHGVEIRARRTSANLSTPELVQVKFDHQGHIAEITGDGASLPSYALEPEALTNYVAIKTGTRPTLAYHDIPPVLVRAIISIEDRHFFDHHGLDLSGIIRAAWNWTRDSDDDRWQGGSTITQQLVKNTYLSPERTVRRKFIEALMASALERRLSKEDIFALYCNEIYLGQRGTVGVRGVEQAARVFFGKELRDLSLAEAATIAGMIQSPNRYSPARHPERAQARRNIVIAAMLRDGAITSEQAEAAAHEPVLVAHAEGLAEATAPYFIDYVNRIIESQIETSNSVDERSLRIYTTIDLELQQLAEGAVEHQLERLTQVYKNRGTPQAALVALDAHTGQVLAMVGGRRYRDSQLNRATDARRQPGSVFKPFVYAAAIEGGISPVTMSTDAPRTFRYAGHAMYRPANYGGAYSMHEVPLRTGLIRSLNVVTVDVAMRAGLQRIATLAESFGLPKPEPYPALALGTTEATPLEIAIAYTALANGGLRVRPAAITRAVDAQGTNFIEELAPQKQLVIRPSTSYILTDMLTDVINQGTARAARGAIRDTAIAGKTGTSHDGWFAGYSPNLVCVVWVGFDDNRQLGLTGAESALPIWTEFMKGAIELRPELGGAAFERPDSITTVEIDPETGQLATPSCPQRERIAITRALAPGFQCDKHNPPVSFIASAPYEEFSAAAEMQTYAHPANLVTSTAITPQTPASHTATSGAFNKNFLRPTTQVEINKNGRPKLTNDLRVEISAR